MSVPGTVDFYAIDENQLAKLTRLAKRLYTEDRMNGDEMRDAAHLLSAIVKAVRELPVPRRTT